MSGATITERLKQTCVLLHDVVGNIGSGYLIARGHAATAAHVVRPYIGLESFDVLVGWPPYRREAKATVVRCDPVADAALLRIEGCDDIDPLPVGRADSGEKWHSFGFPVAMSHNRADATGVHLSGTIIDMRYADSAGTPLIAIYNQEAITKMNMKGASGAPLTVAGGVVGHLVQQYSDTENLAESVSGQLKACPIQAVLRLLPEGVGFHRLPPPPSVDIDVTDLVSWCDRTEVTEELDTWLETGEGGGKLMCLVGHADHRYRPLLNRIARQLSELDYAPVPAEACHILDAVPLGKEPPFRRAVERTLKTPYELAAQSPRFRASNGLVLMSQVCDWPTGPAKDMKQHLLQVAAWLTGLQLGQRRLLVVLVLRFEDGIALDEAADIVDKAMRALRRKDQALHARLIEAPRKGPFALEDYDTGQVRNWIGLPWIRATLGHRADSIEDGLDGGGEGNNWNARKLGDLVKRLLDGQGGNHGRAD
jgi:hypothetical protein